MAIARFVEFHPTGDRGTPNYDAVTKKTNVDGDPPEGMIVHTAGFAEDGTFRIFEVWETSEAMERFDEERLGPAIQEIMGGDGSEPDRTAQYELHHLVRGPALATETAG